MATFTLLIKCYWSKEDGFESLIDDENTTDSGNADDEMDPDENAVQENMDAEDNDEETSD